MGETKDDLKLMPWWTPAGFVRKPAPETFVRGQWAAKRFGEPFLPGVLGYSLDNTGSVSADAMAIRIYRPSPDPYDRRPSRDPYRPSPDVRHLLVDMSIGTQPPMCRFFVSGEHEPAFWFDKWPELVVQVKQVQAAEAQVRRLELDRQRQEKPGQQ
jgi:hypothetical protein